jgi:hypothetical protein
MRRFKIESYLLVIAGREVLVQTSANIGGNFFLIGAVTNVCEVAL